MVAFVHWSWGSAWPGLDVYCLLILWLKPTAIYSNKGTLLAILNSQFLILNSQFSFGKSQRQFIAIKELCLMFSFSNHQIDPSFSNHQIDFSFSN
jgi:hypothetical protein